MSKLSKFSSLSLASSMEEKYGVFVKRVNVTKLTIDDINSIMEKILLEFPMYGFDVKIPKWMRALPADNPVISDMIDKIKESSTEVTKMRDFELVNKSFENNEKFNGLNVSELKLGEGIGEYELDVKEDLYFKVLSEECGEDIKDDYSLMAYIKSFSEEKKKFVKIKDALNSAEETGYGVVLPTVEEMDLEEPMLVKQGGKFGVKLKASAPSLHIMKVDVATEVAPIVGTEKQGEDLINYIMTKFEDNPSGIWETNMFGKSLHDLVNEGLTGKLNAMPKDTQGKMRKTLTKIVNENRGGVICILL